MFFSSFDVVLTCLEKTFKCKFKKNHAQPLSHSSLPHTG